MGAGGDALHLLAAGDHPDDLHLLRKRPGTSGGAAGYRCGGSGQGRFLPHRLRPQSEGVLLTGGVGRALRRGRRGALFRLPATAFAPRHGFGGVGARAGRLVVAERVRRLVQPNRPDRCGHRPRFPVRLGAACVGAPSRKPAQRGQRRVGRAPLPRLPLLPLLRQAGGAACEGGGREACALGQPEARPLRLPLLLLRRGASSVLGSRQRGGRTGGGGGDGGGRGGGGGGGSPGALRHAPAGRQDGRGADAHRCTAAALQDGALRRGRVRRRIAPRVPVASHAGHPSVGGRGERHAARRSGRTLLPLARAVCDDACRRAPCVAALHTRRRCRHIRAGAGVQRPRGAHRLVDRAALAGTLQRSHLRSHEGLLDEFAFPLRGDAADGRWVHRRLPHPHRL
mmetsp:Transcript_12186/g.30664  ORF Transcript_12186/g.30664 Transcript_12186/m.30664 type:complete len:397 (-) Transcript_12186:391-1581(-)